MVAVVNGSGLGLFTSLGSNGSAGLGQTRERVFVNSTTGNLIIQNADELLTANGNDLAITRTYNSLGLVDGDNNDGWRIGVLRSLNIVGSPTAPDRITKTFGDGAQVTYNPVGGGVYRSNEGDGAHDTLQLVSGQWIWTDGSGRNTEYYNSSGQVVEARDADGNRFTYGYTGTLITTIIVVSPTPDGANPGEGGNGTTTTISLEYVNPTTTKQLQRIRVARTGDPDQVLTSYTYDGLGRLETVTVDLTPENTSDSSTFITTYGYDGTSNRVASITQRGGGSSNITARVSFTYIEQDGAFRLQTYTDGEGRITTFTYTLANGGGGSGTTVPADSGVLSTTETQNVSNDYTLTGAASTTDTQATDTTYPVISSQITTGATQTDTYNRNDSALSTTDTQLTVNHYGVNSGLLTTPAGGSWAAAAALEAEPAGSTASAPQVAFDGNGDGFALWAVTTSTTSVLKIARYTRSTNSWASSPLTLYSGSTATAAQASLSVDAAGNALVAWLAGGGISARRYASGAWGSTSTVVSTGATLAPSVSINGNFAAVMWGEGTSTTRSAYVSRWNGSAWTTKATVDNQTTPVSELGLAIDNLGNVIATWTQIEGANTAACVWTNRFSVSGSSWSGAVTRDILSGAANGPQIAMDANGNALMAFGQEGKTFVIRYDRATNTWGSANVLDTRTGDVQQASLSMDTAGNAIFAWVQNDTGVNNLYAATYSATSASWGPSTIALENLSTAVTNGSLKASMRGGFASTTWIQNDGTRDNAYAATFNGSAWTAATLIETSTNAASSPAVAVDSLGNASALWIQSNGSAPSLYSNRFSTGGGAPYYTIPSGASWQSLANTLYGINSAEAGAALQTAMGNPTLTAGAQLSGWPTTLDVTTSTVITVPLGYKIPSGASWQSIANAIYGINSAAAGTALQTAMGNPTLTAGNRLTNLPATISIVTNLAAHYLVPAGATWQSVAYALYGVNSAAAGAKLQTVLSNPALTAGARLYSIPASLTVTTTSVITVPPYYVIPASPSWQALANTLYGINSAAAGSALQALLGNPTLTPGNRLSNLPAKLTVVTQQNVTVPPYYIVTAGANWASITSAVYHTTDAAAVAALQAATGNPALTTGLHLTVPANLTYSTATTISATRQPTYVVSQETTSVPHSDPMTATLSTTQEVTTPTDFNAVTGQFQTTEVRSNERAYSLTGALTTVNDTRTFSLSGTLTYPPKGWGVVAPQTISGATAALVAPRIVFDGNGNGLAVWYVRTGVSPNTTESLRWARYDGVTKTWSAMQSQVIASNSTSSFAITAISSFALAMDSVTGKAVLCWAQNVPGGLASNGTSLPPGTVYASIFNPATNLWATPTSIGSAIRQIKPSVSMRNNIAAVSYTTNTLTMLPGGINNDPTSSRAFVARYNGSTWTQGENRTGSYSSQVGTSGSTVGVDSSGNIHLSFTEGGIGLGRTVYQRWNGSSWSASQIITNWGTPDGINTYGAFGANGDGVIAANSTLYRYVAATGTWTTLSVTGGSNNVMSIDDSGRAIVAYNVNQNLWALTFDGTTWSSPVFMTSISSIGSATVTMRNGRAIVSWSENGTNGATYARTFEDGAWAASPELMGASVGGGSGGGAGIDSTGNMHVLWGSVSSGAFTVTGKRFISAVNAPGYINLDSDPTWQEIAAQLYGQNYASAGEALRVAMGSPALTASGTLSGFPPTLTFNANFPEAPYYIISPTGNTQTDLQNAASALYSNPNRSVPSPEGGVELQRLINIGVITRTGNKLTGMPASINLTALETLPALVPYYMVPNGTTWRSLAATLYNIDSDAAGVSLQNSVNGMSLPTGGTKLLRTSLPDSIRVGVVSQQSTTPYYLVPMSTTWTDITAALYGSATAQNPEAVAALIAALAAANPAVVSIPFGGQLRGMPGTLNYNTSQINNVTPYYVVLSGDTWLTIAQKVYGVPADPGAASALQTLLGNPALTAGAHLLVPGTLPYVPTLGGNTVYQQTEITDALGLKTTYTATVQGRLTSTLSPTVNGARIETRYDYDIDGNLTSVTLDPAGLNRTTAMTYDVNGNMTSSRDAAGNTVTRVFDLTTNTLQSETVYLVPDPDGFGAQTAQSPQTTRFFYDGENHLRFTVSADGRVIESRYFNAGTRRSTHVYGGTAYSGTMSLAALTTWATNRTPVELTEYTYDFRGNISSAKRYETTDANGAGSGTASITTYLYDARGNLLNVIEPRGTATAGDPNDFKTSYLYDGLGRLKQSVEWLSGTDSRTTLNNYQDTLNNVVTTISSTTQPVGRVTTTTYDKSGAITTVTNANTGGTSFGQTLYAYDADNRLRMVTNPIGVRSYVLYDSVSRKSGEVDAEGRLTRYVYNRAGQVIKAVRYSNALSSTALATLVSGGVPANVTVESLVATLALDSTRDQTTRLVYDKAGRLAYSIDAGGSVTRNLYDGAHRVTEVVSYATTLSIAASVDELNAATISVPSSSSDRRQRNFYNADGMLVATLDGGGYLVEFVYDSFGHLQRQIGYAAATTLADRAAGSLATLRASADDTPTADVNSYFYYDGQGRLVGVLDAEGYLTESKYDLAGQVTQKIRYEKFTSYNASLASVRALATGTKNQSTTYTYDGAGRLTNTTNFEGTGSSFTYNAFDQVTAATVADRTTQKRYNAMGWVTQELSGEGSAAIALLGGSPTPAQVEGIWTQWAISHSYDNAGRRKLTTDQYGNRTWYYYDVDSRLRYTVRDQGNNTGEVTEAKYNALGQLTETLVYSGRIGMTSIAGGLVDSTITSAVNAIANSANDAHNYLTYKLTGDVARQSNQVGAQTDYTYNAFGEVTNAIEKQSASVNTEHVYAYDNRGLLTNTRWDPTGINRTEARSYDAFGRLKSVVDQYGRSASSDYDRLGRVVATHGGFAGEDARFEYDAFGRVLKTYDAYNQVTSFSYDDTLKRAVMTTTEGITVTTTHYATGETWSVIDSDGRGPTYTYNKDGQLTGISDGGGTIETRAYDRAGRLDTSTDGRNVITRFAYDPSSRVFTRTQDEGGLALVTRYDYDGQGRVTRVTEPNNRITETTYYTDGRVNQIAVDPNGLNLRTWFEYDLAGDTVKTVEGYQSTQPRSTVYVFDTLGRRIEEVVDPAGLNLHTQYKYDANGNLTRRIDANGYSTWYIYDADNRLQYTINGLGNVTRQTYDLNGRVIATTRYATPVTVVSFGDIVTTLTPTTSVNDHLERTVFDRDGRAVYSIDAIGTVTERTFDASGNVTRVLRYSRGIPVNGTYTSLTSVSAALTTAGNVAGTPGANDQASWTAYDLRGRATFAVSSRNLVIRNKYDAANNVLETRAYATAYTGARTMTALSAWATGAVESNSANRTTLHRYDAAGREKYSVDALGGVTEYTYDAIGNVTRTLAYSKAIATGGTLDTFLQVQQALNTAGNSATDAVAAQRVQWITYDAAGRAAFTVDSIDGTNGRVQRATYDALGNVVQTQAFAVTRLISAATDLATLSGWATSNANGSDHIASYWFDGAGRNRFRVDGEGYVTETRYNDASNSLTTVAYALDATAQGFARTSTYADVVTRTGLAASKVGARQATVWRDAAGRERFALDPENYLVETRYGDASLQRTRYVYGSALAANRLGSSASLADAINAASEVAVSVGTGSTVEARDVEGRLTRITYSLDNSYEEYGYDALDNRSTYRNQKGSIWNYFHDTEGNLLEERTPTVASVSIANDAAFTATSYSASIVTRMTYDLFGNVKTHAEGILRFADNSENASSSRITTYGYDLLNRQVSVTDPTVKIYSGAAGDEQNSVLSGMRVESDFTRVSTTTYDALGNAVMNVDVAGSYSRKAYDSLGRVKYEVDARNNVTQYGYDVFDNRTTTTRYASPMSTSGLGTASAWSAAEIQPKISTGADDRVVTTAFDRRNLQKTVTQLGTYNFTPAPLTPSGPTETAAAETAYEYNAFGEVTKQKVLLQRTGDKYSETNFYYDLKGQVKAIVDPLGYLTRRVYDARGNLLSNYEYARKLSPPWNIDAGVPTPTNSPDPQFGYDHETKYTYDLLGRMTSQSISNVQFNTISGQSVGTSTESQVTSFWYDAVGNRTRERDALGNNTYAYYDVLGRVTAVVEPVRDVDGTAATQNISPLTAKELDVYGNVVRSTRYADGATSASETSYTASAGGLRQIVTYERNNHGQVLRARDAMGYVSYTSYDKRGNVAKEWRPVTTADGLVETQVKIHKYDELGREIALITPLMRSDAFGATIQSRIVSSADTSEPTASSPEWVGQNTVWVTWPDPATGNFRVQVDYVKRTRSGFAGAAATISKDFTSTVGGAWVSWSDLVSASEGGVYSITAVRVYKLDAQGNQNPITLPSGPATHTQVSWMQTEYNAFGEVKQRGVNASEQALGATLQEHFVYDVAGRLVRTNSQDGVEKIYLYDAAGRRTAEIRARTIDLASYTSTTAFALDYTQAMRSEVVYDAGGNEIEQRLPKFSALGTPTTPAIKQSFDRWGNVFEYTDEAGQLRKFKYSVLGNLIETTMPVVQVLDTRSGSTPSATIPTATPIQRNHYDLLGRAIGGTDANGNVSAVTLNNAGQILTENHADNGVKTFSYDGLGRQTLIISEMDAWTRNNYNLDDQLTSVEQEYSKTQVSGNWVRSYLLRQYGYDEAGRRVFETSGESSTLGGQEKTSYFYNLTDDVIRRRSAMQYETRYGYDVSGHKVREQDSIGGTMTWANDFWGRSTNHTDLGGILTSYTYNKAGLLTLQSSAAGQNLQFSYDDAGNMTQIQDGPASRTTTYGYDSAGRRARETTLVGSRTHQQSVISYDALGRLSGVTDLRYSVTYQYDANGNRTRTVANYTDAAQAAKSQTLWYTYDSMNRVKVSQGKDIGGLLSYDASQGMVITYRADGLRQAVTQFSSDMVIKEINTLTGTTNWNVGFGDTTESYGYDSAGRLNAVYRNGEERTGNFQGPPQIVRMGANLVISRQFDNAGRITREDNVWNNTSTTVFGYDDDGRQVKQTGYDLYNLSGIRVFETRNNYDGAGVLRGYSTSGFDRPSGSEHLKYTTYYANSYLSADSYLLLQQSARTVQGSTTVTAGLAKRNYNVNRELVSTEDTKEASNNRYFVNDASGNALTVVRGDLSTQGAVDTAITNAFTQVNTVKAHFFFFATGQATGSVGQLLSGNPQQTATTARFDVNYTGALQQSAPTSVAEVVAREGETLRMIAQRTLGDASLWYLIADENGLVDPSAPLAAGRILRMPNTVVSLSNTSGSFKPFNPGDAIGDTTPSMMATQARAMQCRLVAKIIGMVVQYIVSTIVGYYTTPLIGGAAGGAAGNLAEQYSLLMLNGMYDWGALARGLHGSSGHGDLFNGSLGDILDPFSKEKVRAFKERWHAIGRQLKGGAYEHWTSQSGGNDTDTDLVLNDPLELGARGQVDRQSVVISAAAGAVTSYVSQGISDYGFAGSQIVGAGAGAVAGYATQQAVSNAFGRETHWSWRDVATSALSSMASAGVKSFAGNPNVTDWRVDAASSAASVGVQMLRGGKKTVAEILVDVFGNLLASSLIDSIVNRSETLNPAAGSAANSNAYAATGSPAASAADADVQAAAAAADIVPQNDEALEEIVVSAYRPGYDGFRPTMRNALYYPGINDGFFRRVGSEGTHTYSVQLVGSAFLGVPAAETFNLDRLNHIVAYSQWADENRFTDAATNGVLIAEEIFFNHPADEFDTNFEPLETDTSRNGRVIQQALHGLSGHTVGESLGFAQFLIEKYWFDDAVVGLAMHLTGDSVHHVQLGGNDNPTWDELMDMTTYPTFLGHAGDGHEPDYMNSMYPNQALFGARAFTGAYQKIPGLADLSQVGDSGVVSQSIGTVFGWALDRATELSKGIAGHNALENSWRQAVPDFLPDGVWDLKPELHDIPDAFDLRHGTDPYSNRITYDSTYAETDSFLRGVVDTRSFVDRGIAATKIIAEEYMRRYHPNAPALNWTVSPYSRRGGVR